MPDLAYCSVQSTRSAMIDRAVKMAVETMENGALFNMTTESERTYKASSTVPEAVDERHSSL